MTNGHEENVHGSLITWFVSYGDESTGWYVSEYRASGPMKRILWGYRSMEEAVKDARGYYDHLRLAHHKPFTFELLDGRKVTYGGVSENEAFDKARRYHGDAVLQLSGVPAALCACERKNAHGVRQAGWLICAECAGRVG